MADDEKPELDTTGEPEPGRGEPIAPPPEDADRGTRQDGTGAGPRREQRSDAVPAGGTGDARRGPRQGIGSRDPFESDRGDPAGMRNGSATGSGAGASAGEEPNPESKSGDADGRTDDAG